MSHHFVTVCVVCVLCAAHAPCSAHTDVKHVAHVLSLTQDSGGNRLELLKNQIGSKEMVKIKDTGETLEDIINSSESEIDKRRSRNTRHAVTDGSYYTKKIFQDYGNGDNMTLEGFERLLKKLGLFAMINELGEHEDDLFNQEDKSGVIDNINKETNRSEGLKPKDGKSDGKTRTRCMSSKELLATFARDNSYVTGTENSTILPGWLLERICPAILYPLISDANSGCIEAPESLESNQPEIISQNTWQVWIYSSISIVIISLCGLLGVAVIPIMHKTYYHQFIQFLVALAVGTLCGDAFIHLLPHAMMSSTDHEHSHDHQPSPSHEREHESVDLLSEHNLNMWKGLVAMLGVVVFFFTEKALTMIGEWRKFRQRRNKLPLKVTVMREPDASGNNSVGDKHCKHKYSSYPYCYGEITSETQDNHHNRHHNDHQRQAAMDEEKPLTSNTNAVSKAIDEDVEKRQEEEWKLDESMNNHLKKNNDGSDPPVNEAESYTVIIREHETKHHGHTHSHGHVHSAPESMSSVAWMVIMGDGLHNFTDGMAIGAAFAANIAGGFSTAIAVLCHELPHELGDFAVLLKAGMSAKQAVFYNLLSSVLCLFGMIFGILLGANPAATSWIFAAAAGMFIYIALVDMIPELTSSHSAEGGSQWQCVLQALGLIMGLGIMLVIALYEHDLKNIISN